MSIAGKKILLIDDDLDMHHAVLLMLQPLGCTVTCRSTGPAGLETMRKDRPDLVLLDIMLASPSEGFHLAYEMKEDEQLRGVPVVMISSLGRQMGMNYAKELGSEYVKADAFLDKPVDAATLRKTVETVLASQAKT